MARRNPQIIALGVLAATAVGSAFAAPAGGPAKAAHVAILDFACADAEYGRKLANAIRSRLARHGELEVIDRLTTAETAETLPADTPRQKVAELMAKRLGVTLAVYGSVAKAGAAVRLEAVCVDIRKHASPGEARNWKRTFADDTQRSEAVISKAVCEAVTGGEEWKPPEYGDVKPPADLGKPLNRNGGFEQGHVGWQEPDNVATFIEPCPRDMAPAGRGNVLRVRTDLARWPYIDYVRDIRMGKASPARPPKLGTDTGYGSLGGNEGVHFKSELLKATPGWRYWLSVDFHGPAGKVFVKGFRKTEHALDGLPESSLARLKLTPEQFSALPKEKRVKLVEEEARLQPENFLRECYRWYINCRGEAGKWNRLTECCPPRGGLPADVEQIQIQVYSYWPARTYWYDNVHFYKDPTLKEPIPEEKPRTPNFGRTSDVIERETEKRK
jgi:TolB-like protein